MENSSGKCAIARGDVWHRSTSSAKVTAWSNADNGFGIWERTERPFVHGKESLISPASVGKTMLPIGSEPFCPESPTRPMPNTMVFERLASAFRSLSTEFDARLNGLSPSKRVAGPELQIVDTPTAWSLDQSPFGDSRDWEEATLVEVTPEKVPVERTGEEQAQGGDDSNIARVLSAALEFSPGDDTLSRPVSSWLALTRTQAASRGSGRSVRDRGGMEITAFSEQVSDLQTASGPASAFQRQAQGAHTFKSSIGPVETCSVPKFREVGCASVAAETSQRSDVVSLPNATSEDTPASTASQSAHRQVRFAEMVPTHCSPARQSGRSWIHPRRGQRSRGAGWNFSLKPAPVPQKLTPSRRNVFVQSPKRQAFVDDSCGPPQTWRNNHQESLTLPIASQGQQHEETNANQSAASSPSRLSDMSVTSMPSLPSFIPSLAALAARCSGKPSPVVAVDTDQDVKAASTSLKALPALSASPPSLSSSPGTPTVRPMQNPLTGSWRKAGQVQGGVGSLSIEVPLVRCARRMRFRCSSLTAL